MFAVADFHTHTVYSHGRGSIRDNVEAAHRRGLLQVGISDHGPANLFGVGIRDPDVLEAMRAEIQEVVRSQAEAGDDCPQVFLGIEANVVGLDGSLDLDLAVLERLDYVMVGLHVPVRPRRWPDAFRFAAANLAAKGLGLWGERARRMNTEALIRAVERYPVDVITHPGWRLNIDTPALARACAAAGTALEVNTSHDHGGVAYIQAAAAEGVDFVVGSDAHGPERVGELQAGIRMLMEAGVDPSRVRNAVGTAGERRAAIEESIRTRHPVIRARRGE